MPFNASNFRSVLRHGGARPNMFEIILVNPPKAFGGPGGGGKATSTVNTKDKPGDKGLAAINTFTYMANSGDMPGAIIGTIPIPYFGRFINVAGDRMYEDWNCAVYTDEDMITRNAFESWNNSMAFFNYDTYKEHGELGDKISGSGSYVCDVWVQHYTKTGKIDKIYILKNAFPYVVSPVQMSWQSNDQIMMFQVTWKYDYFITSLKPYQDSDMTYIDAESAAYDIS